MNKAELKAKYNRISNDPRQAQEFVNELIDEVAALEKNQLPDATEAAEGNILSLDSEKKPAWSEPAAGGTKLYKHSIQIKEGSNSTLILLTNSSTPYASQSTIRNAFYNSVKTTFSSGIVNLIAGGLGGQPLTIYYFHTVSGSYTTYEVGASTEVSDTVTEL